MGRENHPRPGTTPGLPMRRGQDTQYSVLVLTGRTKGLGSGSLASLSEQGEADRIFENVVCLCQWHSVHMGAHSVWILYVHVCG